MFNYNFKPPTFIIYMLVLLCINNTIVAQPVVLQTNDNDTLLPAFNKYSESYSASSNYLGVGHSAVFKVAKKGGKYYTMGEFSHLSANQGSALIVDTATNTVITPQKWRVNGIIKTVVPDGIGGYYIGGRFTKIGDSSRRYLARIDASGKPTAWHPLPDSFVNVLLKRNDTLFIGGSFRKFSGITRYCFAIYSLNGDTLINNGGTFGFLNVKSINDMLMVRDTIVYAGSSFDEDLSPIVKKYDFKNATGIAFNLQFTEYGVVSSIQLSPDSSTLIYSFYNNNNLIRGVGYLDGRFKFFLKIYNPIFGAYEDNIIKKIRTVGNTTYVVGLFTGIQSSDGNIFVRKGFAGFNTYTGLITAADIHADGFSYFIEILGNQIIVSGKFNEIAGQPRTNMVALDTGTLALKPFTLSPTDQLTAICMQGTKTFIAGEFKGLFAIRRNGFAAIDAATYTVTAWNPPQHPFIAARRMFISGDSLFVLGVTGYSNANYIAALKLYSISNGTEYTVPDLNYIRIRDCVIDGNYLYLSADKKLRRYRLPGLILDPSWGTDWNNDNPLLNVHDPTRIIVDSTKIYTVGDTRYQNVNGNFSPRRGYVAKYNKSTGVAEYISYYEDTLPLYNAVTFENATLSDNKIYITGYFNKLNGQQRKNFACVNATDGSMLPLQTNFSNANLGISGFNNASSLLVRDNKLWFAAPGSVLADGNLFGGFGALDTSNGVLQSPPLVSLKTFEFQSFPGAYEYILNKNELVIVGSFDSANAIPKCNIVRFKLVPYYALTYTFIGNGNWDVPSNWQEGTVPPLTITNDIQIVIDPVVNGECLLSRQQIIPTGSAIILKQNKKFRVTGNLKIDAQ